MFLGASSYYYRSIVIVVAAAENIPQVVFNNAAVLAILDRIKIWVPTSWVDPTVVKTALNVVLCLYACFT